MHPYQDFESKFNSRSHAIYCYYISSTWSRCYRITCTTPFISTHKYKKRQIYVSLCKGQTKGVQVLANRNVANNARRSATYAKWL